MNACLISSCKTDLSGDLIEALVMVDRRVKVEHYQDAPSALLAMRNMRIAPRIVILQLDADSRDGVDAIRLFRIQAKGFPIVAVGDSLSESSLLAIIRNGISGCIASSSTKDEMALCLKYVLRGDFSVSPVWIAHLFRLAGSPLLEGSKALNSLTQREGQILSLLSKGYKYSEVAVLLGISLSTVQTHVRAIYAKLNSRSLVQALDIARRHHLI